MENSVFATIIALATLLLASLQYYFKRKIERGKLLKTLFTEFNERYAMLDEKLYDIKSKGIPASDLVNLDSNSYIIKDVISYFNLCAEEYFWYKNKLIHKTIWKSWEAGMNYWYDNVPIIKALWKEELQNNRSSYYLGKKDNIFGNGRNSKNKRDNYSEVNNFINLPKKELENN